MQPNEELTLDIPPLDLDIPKPIKLQSNGETIYGWNAKGYATILKVWTGYTLWADNYIHESELETIFTERLEICESRIALKNETIDLLAKDRKHAYDLFNEERKEILELKRKNTLKTILVSGSVGLVALAGGVLIGFFAGR